LSLIIPIGCYQVVIFLKPLTKLRSFDSPCASDVLLAIKEHLVCSANFHCFGHTQSYLWKLSVIVDGALGCLFLSVTFSHRERKLIAKLVSFLLTSESMQLKLYSLGEACLKVCLSG
jgi:hypothetical protein